MPPWPSASVANKILQTFIDHFPRMAAESPPIAIINDMGYVALSRLQSDAAETTIPYSRERDADIAEEIAQLTRNQILVQTSTAMVGQSNLIPQSVLQLLA